MPKFIYVSDNKIELYSPIDTVTFTCVSEHLLIDFVTLNPLTASVLWTQTAGSPITILNSNTITPTIIFPSGFNTEASEVVLKVTAVGNENIFVAIKVNTRIGSIYENSSYQTIDLNRNTFLSQDAIPSELTYYYQDYYNEDTSVVYLTSNPNIQVTYKTVTDYSNLYITKVNWLKNINGVYTVSATSILPNKSFNYIRNTNTKAQVFYTLGDSQKEIVETNILKRDLLNSAAALGVSNYYNDSIVITNTNYLSSITTASYIFNVIETTQNYQDDYINSIVLLNSNVESVINSSFYLFAAINTLSEYGDEYTNSSQACFLNSNIMTQITISSYLFNNNGTIIG